MPNSILDDDLDTNSNKDKEDELTIEDNELEDKEDKEKDELEEEDKEDDDKEDKKDKEDKEEEELIRVELSEINKEFPQFFKKFPTLKHAFFREQQFSEIYPTIEEAQKAADMQAAYEEISSAVTSGDAETFIGELTKESPDGLKKFATNFVPALLESNKDLYYDVVTPIVRQFVRNVYAHGVGENNDNIKNAAKIVHKVLFSGSYDDVAKEGELATRKSKDKDDTIEKDKQQYFQGKYQNLQKEVGDLLYGRLDEEINKGLEDLTKTRPGLKKMIFKDIRARVLDEMDKDKNHLSRMNQLWKREERNGFNGSLKNSFLVTFMSKAKTLIPKMRIEARKEALGKDDTGGNNRDNNREPNRHTGGRESKGGTKRMTPERAKSEGLSTKGIFDAD